MLGDKEAEVDDRHRLLKARVSETRDSSAVDMRSRRPTIRMRAVLNSRTGLRCRARDGWRRASCGSRDLPRAAPSHRPQSRPGAAPITTRGRAGVRRSPGSTTPPSPAAAAARWALSAPHVRAGPEDCGGVQELAESWTPEAPGRIYGRTSALRPCQVTASMCNARTRRLQRNDAQAHRALLRGGGSRWTFESIDLLDHEEDRKRDDEKLHDVHQQFP